jgi:hypothetical protein
MAALLCRRPASCPRRTRLEGLFARPGSGAGERRNALLAAALLQWEN